MKRAGVAWLAILAGLAAVQPSLADPRSAGARPDPSTDEGGLWRLSEQAETQARRSADLDQDPALTAYVRGVECKVAADYCPDIRVYVLDRPFFNAQMAPNGYMEVWSGLLLRVNDETELAFVLGHETTHFVESHSVLAWREAKSRSGQALVVGFILGAATMGVAGALPTELAYLGATAQLYGFSREQEAAADHGGWERARKAGFPGSPAGIWKSLLAETAASDFDSVRKAETHGGVFESHPLTAERLAAVNALDANVDETAVAAAREEGRKRYRAAIRPHLGDWLAAELRRRDYGESLHVIDRLAASGDDPGVLGFYRGEAYRLRRKDGDDALARTAYQAAASQADAPVAVWRELGGVCQRLADKACAKTAFETYLAKAPGADDAWMVQDSLKSL